MKKRKDLSRFAHKNNCHGRIADNLHDLKKMAQSMRKTAALFEFLHQMQEFKKTKKVTPELIESSVKAFYPDAVIIREEPN